MKPLDFLLFALVVFGWSTSWLPLKWQVAGAVAPEVSVMWRFLIAGSLMMGYAIFTGKWRLAWREQISAVGIGLCLFSMNFTLFYYGAYGLTSGLLAVVFATASLINLFYGRLVFGTAISSMGFVATVLGFSGVVLLYWPELTVGSQGLVSLLFCVVGTLFFCSGNMISAASQKRSIPVVTLTAWGMLYGAALLFVIALIRGKPFIFELTASYWIGTVWLSIFSSIIAFGAYLTLLGRIGPGRAAYATVLFPPFALLISTFVEGYQWTLTAVIGLCMVLGGILLLTRTK